MISETLHPRFRTLALVSALALALGGCTIHTVRGGGTVRAHGSVRVTTPTYVTVSDAPPPLKPAVRTRPAPAANGAVWIEGHWSWNGGWVWVDGRWDTPPEPSYVWEPPVVVAVAGGGYQYHRGYWHPRSQQPPAVYRADGAIRVHVRPADEPPRADRVVVRAGEPPPNTVVVTATAPEGPSSSVAVRTRPAEGGATVRTRPAEGGATVRTRPAEGGATVRTRPSDDGGATVRADGGQTANTRVRPASQARDGGQTANTRVRPASQARDNGQTANTRVRPASQARDRGQSANTNVRPATQARDNGQTANTRVRPASQARDNGQTANTNVRPATQARDNGQTANPNVRPPSQATDNTARPNTRVRTPNTQGPRSCRLQVAVLPRNGVLVIRGSGLMAATGVMIGSQRVPLLDKRDDRVRARVQGRNQGGSVKVLFGDDDRESCGNLRITGR